MSVPHHNDDAALHERFLQQAMGQYERKFPDGRIGADDDGDLTLAMAVDHNHKVIRIQFAHPTQWLGLNRESAERMRDMLSEKLLELRGITK